MKKTKIHKDDYWSAMNQDVSTMSDKTTKFIFTMLLEYINKYNDLHGTYFKFFETRRKVDRQRRLMKKGLSQVANAANAPHVRGRAVDVAEYMEVDGKLTWVWRRRELRKLHTWLQDNFPLFLLLRTGGNFRNFDDLPHYEIKLDIWNSYRN